MCEMQGGTHQVWAVQGGEAPSDVDLSQQAASGMPQALAGHSQGGLLLQIQVVPDLILYDRNRKDMEEI